MFKWIIFAVKHNDTWPIPEYFAYFVMQDIFQIAELNCFIKMQSIITVLKSCAKESAKVFITGRSLPYRTNTGPTVSLFSCCWTQPHKTSNKPTRVLIFRLLYRLYMKYTFTWVWYASAPKVWFQLTIIYNSE